MHSILVEYCTTDSLLLRELSLDVARRTFNLASHGSLCLCRTEKAPKIFLLFVINGLLFDNRVLLGSVPRHQGQSRRIDLSKAKLTLDCTHSQGIRKALIDSLEIVRAQCSQGRDCIGATDASLQIRNSVGAIACDLTTRLQSLKLFICKLGTLKRC